MLAIEQYTRRLLKDFYPIVAANRPPVDLAPEPADREHFVPLAAVPMELLGHMDLALGLASWLRAS